MKYSKDWLIKLHVEGERLKYLHFWGHQPSADGTITSSCFSQWWSADFVVDGITYKTAEHYMMAEKARLFGDDVTRSKIIACTKPAEAKELGRSVLNFTEEIWRDSSFVIVVKGNLEKFSQNEALKTYLVNTQDRIIVEASPVDTIWGNGHATDHKYANQPEHWRGLNLLGFALMDVRDRIK